MRTVRILIGEIYAVLIELRAARCLLGDCEKRCLIELRTIRSLLG